MSLISPASETPITLILSRISETTLATTTRLVHQITPPDASLHRRQPTLSRVEEDLMVVGAARIMAFSGWTDKKCMKDG